VSGDECYNLACLYSLSAAAARDDKRLPFNERARLAESRISDALRWLKSSAEAGLFKNPDARVQAKSDPDLEILRDRAEFRLLLQSGETKP
jgi:hypothetical protein